MEGMCPAACGSWLLESLTMTWTNDKNPNAPGRKELTLAHMTLASSSLQFIDYLTEFNLGLPSPR